jgi:hypothetical protein
MVVLKAACKLFALCCIIAFCGGCGPQFIPKQLKNRPLSELVELNLFQDSKFQVLEIDGVKKYGLITYVAPGMHSIKYRVYEETEEWKNLVKTMDADGYTLRPDGSFKKIEDGKIKIATPLASPFFKRYGWTTRTKEVSFEGGRKYLIKYDLDSLGQMIINITPTN